jgi:predicted molibdopterin-dependent oxidoreductase YjgC
MDQMNQTNQPVLPERFEIFLDGRPLEAQRGQTIAEALLAAGVRTFRYSRSGSPRGPFCTMGVCFECRMTVDGRPNVRTCQTPALPGCRVERQSDAATGESR